MRTITGIYTDLRFVDEAGDLVGVELFLLNTVDGYHVVFQSAEGGAATVPIVVKANVTGDKIEFTLPDYASFPGKFSGQIEADRIVGAFEKGYLSPARPGSRFVLLKKSSYWQVKTQE